MFDSLFLCILDAAHDRILSVRTSYSQYFTNCYEATNLRNLLTYNYWRYFYTEYLLRGSFFLYPFPTILSGHKCILFCVLIITHKRIQSIRTPYTQFFTWYYKDFKFFCIQVLDIYFPKKLLKSNFFVDSLRVLEASQLSSCASVILFCCLECGRDEGVVLRYITTQESDQKTVFWRFTRSGFPSCSRNNE